MLVSPNIVEGPAANFVVQLVQPKRLAITLSPYIAEGPAAIYVVQLGQPKRLAIIVIVRRDEQ